MIRAMLCGAGDTKSVVCEFNKVIEGFGGYPFYYQTGNFYYNNSTTSDFTNNSKANVQIVDLCVFVLVKQVGKITWSDELEEALLKGKPFLILCNHETYQTYITLKGSKAIVKKKSDEYKQMCLLRDLESKNLTIVQFRESEFANELRKQLSTLCFEGLKLVEIQNQRNSVLKLEQVDDSRKEYVIGILKQIAKDETADKFSRKRAIRNLLSVGIDFASILELLDSSEQGVKRLCFEHLDDLIGDGKADQEFITECIRLANEADDVGISRRLITKILKIDLKLGLTSLDKLELFDVGTKRRLVLALSENETIIQDKKLEYLALGLLRRCLGKSSEDSWTKTCKELIERLS